MGCGFESHRAHRTFMQISRFYYLYRPLTQVDHASPSSQVVRTRFGTCRFEAICEGLGVVAKALAEVMLGMSVCRQPIRRLP